MCSKVNHLYEFEYIYPLGFPDGPVVKILPANAGDSRDVGLVPGLGRSPGVRNGNCQAPLSMGFSKQDYWSGLLCPPPGDLSNSAIEPTSLASYISSILTWKIPWTEEPGGLQSMRLQSQTQLNAHMCAHTHTIFYCIYLPHPFYPFLLCWTFNFIPCLRFFPCPSYCK